MNDTDKTTATAQAPEVPPKPPQPKQAETLLKLVRATGATFFHTDTSDLYATIPVDGHTEIWPINGRDFKMWLQSLYYKTTKKTIGNEAITEAVSVVSAEARFDKPDAVTLSTRITKRSGAIWYDLTNDKWQAIKITSEGWKVYDNPPVMFTRYRHQAPQVIPQPGGDIRKVLKYINVKHGKTLFLVWLVSCFIPSIPRPLLITYGEKGAGKSTANENAKAIIDPSSLSTLTIASDPRSMLVNLRTHYFLPFDNVSHINEETSDTLCRAITGGGVQNRQLFTDADDVIFTFKRCISINGINNVATRPDLLDRSILVELQRISEHERREISAIKAEFEADRAAILGGILDTLAKAMKLYPSVKLERLHRMADFTRWGYAIGEALGGLGKQFMKEYDENRETQNTEAINNDPVATLIVALMADKKEWSGTVSLLYEALKSAAHIHSINTNIKSFPVDPARLSKRIRAIRSNLEMAGIWFEDSQHHKSRGISLYTYNPTVATVAPLQTAM